jgi:hypothetical protein
MAPQRSLRACDVKTRPHGLDVGSEGLDRHHGVEPLEVALGHGIIENIREYPLSSDEQHDSVVVMDGMGQEQQQVS